MSIPFVSFYAWRHAGNRSVWCGPNFFQFNFHIQRKGFIVLLQQLEILLVQPQNYIQKDRKLQGVPAKPAYLHLKSYQPMFGNLPLQNYLIQNGDVANLEASRGKEKNNWNARVKCEPHSMPISMPCPFRAIRTRSMSTRRYDLAWYERIDCHKSVKSLPVTGVCDISTEIKSWRQWIRSRLSSSSIIISIESSKRRQWELYDIYYYFLLQRSFWIYCFWRMTPWIDGCRWLMQRTCKRQWEKWLLLLFYSK